MAQAAGEDMAKAIGEFTADPDEQALLTWAVAYELKTRGQDDDTWDPAQRREFVSRIYSKLREAGHLKGPQEDPFSGIAKLQADLEAGRISPEQYQVGIQSMLKPSTTVNVGPTGIDYGDPEAGYAWARNPDGTVALSQDANTGFMRPVAVPIAGGKVEQAAQAAEEAAAAQKEQQAVYADVVTDTVDDLIAKAEEFSVTGMFSLINFIPGTPQHDAARMVETIKANVGFDRLQQMREASDTGGALGQVSEFENRLLQSTIGNLELSQTQEQFLKILAA